MQAESYEEVFDMNEPSQVTERVLLQAQERVIKVMESLYDHDNKIRMSLETAKINIYVCSEVEALLNAGTPYWQAVTGAVMSTLDRFPLEDA